MATRRRKRKKHNIMVIIEKRFQIFRLQRECSIQLLGGFLNVQWDIIQTNLFIDPEKNSLLFLLSSPFGSEIFLSMSAGRDNDQHFSRLWAIIQGKIIEQSIHSHLKFIGKNAQRPHSGVVQTQLPSDYIKNIYTAMQRFNLIIKIKYK